MCSARGVNYRAELGKAIERFVDLGKTMSTGGSSVPWANFLVRVFVQLATFNEGAEIWMAVRRRWVGSLLMVLNFLRSDNRLFIDFI